MAGETNYRLILSAEDGAIIRQYEAKFALSDREEKEAEKAEKRYKNRDLIEVFRKKKPKAYFTDYNMTLAGIMEESGEQISEDTSLLLRKYMKLSKAEEEKTGEKRFFGVLSGNYAKNIVNKLAGAGIEVSGVQEEVYRAPTSSYGTKWLDCGREVQGSLGEMYSVWKQKVETAVSKSSNSEKLEKLMYWQDNEVRPTLKSKDVTNPLTKELFETGAHEALGMGIKSTSEGGLMAVHGDCVELLVPSHSKETALRRLRDRYNDLEISRTVYSGDSASNDYLVMKFVSENDGSPVVVSNERYVPSKDFNLSEQWVEALRENTGKLKRKLPAGSFLETMNESITNGAGANEVLTALIYSMDETDRETGKKF